MAEARSRQISRSGSSAKQKDGVWTPADRPRYDGLLLLDTHVWIWMLEGDTSRMSPRSVPLLERAAASRQLFVSDISFWEVALKSAKGKLVLSLDMTIWLRKAESAPGVGYLPLDRTILIQSARLAGDLHGDPADRILIASAQLHGMSLVTADAVVTGYARITPGVAVCDVRR